MYILFPTAYTYSTFTVWLCKSWKYKLKKKQNKTLLDLDFGPRVQQRGQTAVQLRAAGHSPVCFLSTVEFIWARSYKHMNGPQCVHSVLTSLHRCGWDAPCPGKFFRKSLCRLRRVKQCWFEAMLELPGCATGLRTIAKPSPCWSSIDQSRSYSLCTSKNCFLLELTDMTGNIAFATNCRCFK